MAIGKLKKLQSSGTDQIQAEFILEGSRNILSEVTQLFNSIWYRKEMLEEWNDSIIVLISKKIDKTDCSNYRGVSVWSVTYNILSNFLLLMFSPNA